MCEPTGKASAGVTLNLAGNLFEVMNTNAPQQLTGETIHTWTQE